MKDNICNERMLCDVRVAEVVFRHTMEQIQTRSHVVIY